MKLITAAAPILVALTLIASAVASPDPKSVALTLNDMPTGFALKSGKYYDVAAAAKDSHEPVSQFKSWGYVTGYEGQYGRDVSLGSILTGPIFINSYASIYSHEDGASKSIDFSIAAAHKLHAQELSMGAHLGDDGHLLSNVKKSGGYTYQFYMVVWRHHAVKNTVVVGGIKGGVSPQQAVNLAKAQEKRN